MRSPRGQQKNARAFEARIRAQAARSIASAFDQLYEGAFAVDMQGNVTWMNDKFRALLGLNGIGAIEGTPIETYLPNSHIREVIETGRPTILDVFELGKSQVVVSRIPLIDDSGVQTGAMGVILYDRIQALKPLVSKFEDMQHQLAATRKELTESRRAKYTFARIIGADPALEQLKQEARSAATRESAVLLLGETGTGKELFAHAIHAAGPRADGPVVAVNVAALPEHLVEAELFGAAPGAYTGMGKVARQGKFELADGGTLFLDEIGDLPLTLQPKLLRALEQKEFEPLGSSRMRRADIRIIAATSRDLTAMVEEGSFRADLYYRLAVITLKIPPLRDRKGDVTAIARHLLEVIATEHGEVVRDLDDKVLPWLSLQDWPGNIRELKNRLEQAVLRCDGRHVIRATDLGISEKDLPRQLPLPVSAPIPGGASVEENTAPRLLKEVLAEAERKEILKALAAADGNRSQAAKLLGVSRAQFYQKMSNHDLDETDLS